jgi:hypothetical protein
MIHVHRCHFPHVPLVASLAVYLSTNICVLLLCGQVGPNVCVIVVSDVDFNVTCSCSFDDFE